VPSWEQGPAARTLFDAMHDAGRPTAAVFGDDHLVGVTGARRADFVWPDGEWEAGVARDVLGCAKDRETTTRVVEAVGDGAHLVVAQLNEPDTAAHAAQVAVVTGGHPAAQRLAHEISRWRPTAAWWAPRLARVLGIAAPSG
jgi:hypothetical protein